jgi:hypothetical protein
MKIQNFVLKLNIIVGLFICVIPLLSSCNKQNITDLSPYCGVWANNNCELVQTEKYTLLFERNNNKIFVTLRQNEKVNNMIYSKFFSGYIFDTHTKAYEKIVCDKNKEKLLIDDYLKLQNGQLKLLQESQPIELQSVEKIAVSSAYEMPVADNSTIGKCLQYWQLGTLEHSINPDNVWIEIGTNKHSYIFVENPNQLYFRAARLRHNNYGSVFSQNIRIMFSAYSEETTVEMDADNLKTTANDIYIDNSLFKPDMCSFEENGIYWSVVTCNPNVIKLNGCGETYTYERPAIDNKIYAEWFKYYEY